MDPNPQIFRQYDIRGIVGPDLTDEVAMAIGRAFASEVRSRGDDRASPTLVVGHDNRPSSPGLAEALIGGARAAGADVIFIGTVPTPVLYFATARFSADAGLQITGSHNPPEYNGFKMMIGDRAIYGDAILDLERRIREEDYEHGRGAREDRDVLPLYVEDVTTRFTLARPVKLVADCGNGVGSLVVVELLRAIGCEVIPLYCESDGTFPNHHPDPTVDANLVDLIERVRREEADAGVAFDGDADRLGVVDQNGHVVRGDLLLLLFGLDVLERLGPGQTMIFDVKCSQALTEVFEKAGGVPIMWRTGHSLIKEKMKESGAPIAGELSGHICFADEFYGFDDAPYAACRLAELLARSPRSLSELIADFPAYVSTPEIRVDVPEERKFAIVERAVEHFRREHEVIDVDGARVLFEGGWGLLRASNTQPVLVLRFEAVDLPTLERIRSRMEGWLSEQGVSTG